MADEKLARIMLTYNGQDGDVKDPIPEDTDKETVKRLAQEALRTGGVEGIAAVPDADLTDFVVEFFPATGELPARAVLRPKTEYGTTLVNY